MDWPANAFWDYSLALYGQPGVEAACLELQRRHGLDVNLVLLCCWAARRGIALDGASLARARAAVDGWQAEVVRPLRALRRWLKAKLADPDPGSVVETWPALAGAIRERALALEIDAEHLAQLGLARLTEPLPAGAPPGVRLAAANLARYWSFEAQDRDVLRTLLSAAFPEAGPPEVERALGELES